jgi:hypothetical protein
LRGTMAILYTVSLRGEVMLERVGGHLAGDVEKSPRAWIRHDHQKFIIYT